MFKYNEYYTLFEEIHHRKIVEKRMNEILDELDFIFRNKITNSSFWKFLKEKDYRPNIKVNKNEEFIIYTLTATIDRPFSFPDYVYADVVKIPLCDLKIFDPKELDLNNYSTFIKHPVEPINKEYKKEKLY